MTTQLDSQERTRLHRWIDDLHPRQFNLIYQLVEELVYIERDDTEYLLNSNKMRERLLVARESSEGVSFEDVREELGI